MSKFILPHKRKYKTNASWLDAVYRKNKALIDPHMHGDLSKKRQFFDLVKEQKQSRHLKMKLNTNSVSTKEAVKSLFRTREFTSYEEQSRLNIRESLRGTKEEEELLKKVGAKRLYTKNFVYDKNEKAYRYKDVLVKKPPSPPNKYSRAYNII
jgi:NADH dehydrogenase/NADH:ubiquinone oxidoreductase subunit G